MQDNDASQGVADNVQHSDGTEATSLNNTPTTDTSSPSIDPVKLEQSYKHLQEAYRQSREEVKGFRSQFESISPDLDTVRKLKEAFGPKAEEKNFWQALPENYQSHEQKLQAQAQELEKYKSEMQSITEYLASQAEAQEFNKFDAEVGEIYNSKADLDLAKQKIVEYIPNALQQWQQGRSLKSLHDEMIGKEYSNPNSPLVRSIQARIARRETSKSSNYIDGSSRGFSSRVGGNENDVSVISITPSEF